MAVPMKKQMINIEQLRFPSGVAAAETLHALHSKSNKGAARALASRAYLPRWIISARRFAVLDDFPMKFFTSPRASMTFPAIPCTRQSFYIWPAGWGAP